MATTQHVPVVHYSPLRPVEAKTISLLDPIAWLTSGWHSFMAARNTGLLFGAIFAVSGIVISYAALSNLQMMFTFWSGFLLIAPILSLVIYDIAQRREEGHPISLRHSGVMVWQNLRRSLLLAVFLAVVMVAWIRVSSLITILYVGNIGVGVDISSGFFSADNIGLMLTLSAVGAVFAIFLFSLLAWSMPMLVRGKTDLITAMVSSARAVITQPLPMLAWGVIIGALTLVSMLTFFIAFIVIFPWLGFATWEAYKRVFE